MTLFFGAEFTKVYAHRRGKAIAGAHPAPAAARVPSVKSNANGIDEADPAAAVPPQATAP